MSSSSLSSPSSSNYVYAYLLKQANEVTFFAEGVRCYAYLPNLSPGVLSWGQYFCRIIYLLFQPNTSEIIYFDEII